VSRYYYQLTEAQNKKVNARVAERLNKAVTDMFEGFPEMMPGLTEVSGRARLQFYNQTTPEWWTQVAAIYPNEAWQMMLEWGRLLRRYEMPGLMLRPVA
jgi:hypothetical protein